MKKEPGAVGSPRDPAVQRDPGSGTMTKLAAIGGNQVMRLSHCAGVLILLVAWDCEAQRPPVAALDPRYFRVDFIVPGARPSGLAGAFIAAAQDEISSSVNPAGMTRLDKPGASTHQRWSQLNYDEPEGSPDNPTGTKRFRSSNFEQSLVSLVYPMKKFAFSMFRQVQMDSRFEFETQQFLTTRSPLNARQVLGGLGNFPGRRVTLNLTLVDECVAMAYAPSNRISFGACTRLSFLRISASEHLFLDPEVANGSAPRRNSVETMYSVTTLDQTDVAPTYDLGMLATLFRNKLFLGAVAHVRPKYTFHSDVFLPEYTVGAEVLPASLLRNVPFDFHIPDSQGLGFYYVMMDRLRFAFDVARIEYSDLLDGNSRNAIADDTPDAGGTYRDPDGQPDLVATDAYEFHVGVEFIADLPWLGIVPVRAGAFTNPGHRIHASEGNVNLQGFYPEAKDRTYFAGGIGIVPIGNFKLDLGLLASREVNSVTGSAHIEF